MHSPELATQWTQEEVPVGELGVCGMVTPLLFF